MRPGIFDIENWREIGATLARNKTRTFLTAFGIFWGTTMLALLWGGSNGFEGIMRRNFSGVATNLGVLFSEQRSISYKGFNKGTRWSMTNEDIDAILQVAPAIEYSSAICSQYVYGSYESKTTAGSVIGVEDDYSKIMTINIIDGRFLNASDMADGRKAVAIGKNRAAELFGDESPIGKYVKIYGIYFQCVGVVAQIGDASIGGRIEESFIVPMRTFQNTIKHSNNIDFLVYTAPQGSSPMDNEDAIRRVLSLRHYIHPDDKNAVSFWDVTEQFKAMDTVFIGISILALFVGLGSLLAGVIGVGNIMWIVVKERTHEFGIRRAIGAKPSDITIQVLSESILLTLVAGAAGVSFATIVLGILDQATIDPLLGKAGFCLPFSAAIGIVVTFFILGTAAGTLPAIKAMSIRPIEAIRDK